MAALEFVVFFVVSIGALAWLANQVLGPKYTDDTGPLRKPVSALLIVAALAIAYLLAFQRPLQDDIDCRPAGPAIQSGC